MNRCMGTCRLWHRCERIIYQKMIEHTILKMPCTIRWYRVRYCTCCAAHDLQCFYSLIKHIPICSMWSWPDRFFEAQVPRAVRRAYIIIIVIIIFFVRSRGMRPSDRPVGPPVVLYIWFVRFGGTTLPRLATNWYKSSAVLCWNYQLLVHPQSVQSKQTKATKMFKLVCWNNS